MTWQFGLGRLRPQLLSMVLMLSLGAGVLRASVLAPESGSPISLILGDNESPYFKLGVDSSTFIDVTGPGDLKLLVRVAMPATSVVQSRWVLKVTEGPENVAVVDTMSIASDATWKDSPLRPSQGCKISIAVPDGIHRYKVTLNSASKTFAGVRYLFSTGTAKVANSAVYPVDMLEATSVELKERVLDFFLADTVRAVRVKVIGPTQLRIITRLAYNGVMKGPQKYAAIVEVDSKPVTRAALETTKSPATSFTNHREWSVGESRTILVEIPEGTHEASVRLGSSTAPALAMRFTIPKEDIGK